MQRLADCHKGWCDAPDSCQALCANTAARQGSGAAGESIALDVCHRDVRCVPSRRRRHWCRAPRALIKRRSPSSDLRCSEFVRLRGLYAPAGRRASFARPELLQRGRKIFPRHRKRVGVQRRTLQAAADEPPAVGARARLVHKLWRAGGSPWTAWSCGSRAGALGRHCPAAAAAAAAAASSPAGWSALPGSPLAVHDAAGRGPAGPHCAAVPMLLQTVERCDWV